MKRIISMFLVGAACVLAANVAWALESIDDAGTRINRSSNSSPVIMSYYDGNAAGSAINGTAWATTGDTMGIYGRSKSNSGTGVYGENTSDTGVTYGVYGKVASPDGYAGYFNGKVGMSGSLKNPNTLWGFIGLPVYVDDSLSVSGNLYVNGNITTRNLARSPRDGASVSAIAKTEYYTGSYPANNIIDGIKGQWNTGELASNGEKGDTWIQLFWTAPQTITKCIFYDRSNKYDNITDAHLLIDQTGDG